MYGHGSNLNEKAFIVLLIEVQASSKSNKLF